MVAETAKLRMIAETTERDSCVQKLIHPRRLHVSQHVVWQVSPSEEGVARHWPLQEFACTMQWHAKEKFRSSAGRLRLHGQAVHDADCTGLRAGASFWTSPLGPELAVTTCRLR